MRLEENYAVTLIESEYADWFLNTLTRNAGYVVAVYCIFFRYDASCKSVLTVHITYKSKVSMFLFYFVDP